MNTGGARRTCRAAPYSLQYLSKHNDLLERGEKNSLAASNQADFLPVWYRYQSGLNLNRLHPQSVPDQTYYQDWATSFGSYSSPFISSTPRQPRIVSLPPTPLPPDVEIDGPKGVWPNTYNKITGQLHHHHLPMEALLI
jgi:hypothetical protein